MVLKPDKVNKRWSSIRDSSFKGFLWFKMNNFALPALLPGLYVNYSGSRPGPVTATVSEFNSFTSDVNAIGCKSLRSLGLQNWNDVGILPEMMGMM